MLKRFAVTFTPAMYLWLLEHHERRLERSLGMRTAFLFTPALLNSLDAHFESRYEYFIKSGIAWLGGNKYLDGVHCESSELEEVHKKTVRVQSVIYPDDEDSFKMDVEFFGKLGVHLLMLQLQIRFVSGTVRVTG